MDLLVQECTQHCNCTECHGSGVPPSPGGVVVHKLADAVGPCLSVFLSVACVLAGMVTLSGRHRVVSVLREGAAVLSVTKGLWYLTWH